MTRVPWCSTVPSGHVQRSTHVAAQLVPSLASTGWGTAQVPEHAGVRAQRLSTKPPLQGFSHAAVPAVRATVPWAHFLQTTAPARSW